MKKLPAYIMGDGEPGAPDNASGLKDPGKTSEGHSRQNRQQALRVRKCFA